MSSSQSSGGQASAPNSSSNPSSSAGGGGDKTSNSKSADKSADNHATPDDHPLILSTSGQDGSLLSTSLSTVIAASLSSLYDDLNNMTNFEIPVVSQSSVPTSDQNQNSQDGSSNATGQEESNGSTHNPVTLVGGVVPQSSMSSLSFAQRRHEVGCRIAKHSKSILHLSTLTEMYQLHNVHASNASTSCEFADIIKSSSESLKHVREAWMNADEAQDALYFSHGSLWRSGRRCYDVLGAMDLICSGEWRDMSKDVKLEVDAYDISLEKNRSLEETEERLRCVVRRKLICGEVGNYTGDHKFPWKVILEKNGGVVRLTYGECKKRKRDNPANNNDDLIYPIEARLTVLSEADNAEWTLLSIDVHVEPKTGESSHQLETNNRQKFDLHRLCNRSMQVEEATYRKFIDNKSKEENDDKKDENGNKNDEDDKQQNMKMDMKMNIARPLECMFDVSHTFAFLMQLQMLSTQAEALKKGSWGCVSGGITVSPISYIDNNPDSDLSANNNKKGNVSTLPQAMMAIHFWTVDDRYGRPKLADCSFDQIPTQEQTFSFDEKQAQKKLTLSIRTVPKKGLAVSLSGGNAIQSILSTSTSNMTNMDSKKYFYLKRNVQKLLHSIHNPFTVSASHALLSASVICAHMRCLSVMEALKNIQQQNNLSRLPDWIKLSVDAGTLDVSIQILSRPFFTVFRFSMDSRTGRFITTFPPCAHLLRKLSCNDPTVSSLHSHQRIYSTKKTTSQQHSKMTKELTGRIVRDAFDGLHRSLNILGMRVGVGMDQWDDFTPGSEKLRQKVIDAACADVKRSLMLCCGYAGVFGAGSLALGVWGGVDPVVDMAGGLLTTIEKDKFLQQIEQTNEQTNTDFLPIPPLGIILDQQIIEKNISPNGAASSLDDDHKTRSILRRNIFALMGSICNQQLQLHGLDIVTEVDSPSSVPIRVECTLVPLSNAVMTDEILNSTIDPITPSISHKRTKMEDGGHADISQQKEEDSSSPQCTPSPTVMDEVQHLSQILKDTLDDPKIISN